MNKLKKFSRAILDDVNGCNYKPDSEILDCVNDFVQQHNIQLNSAVKRVNVNNNNNNLFLFDVQDAGFPVKFALFLTVAAVVKPAPVVESPADVET